MTPDELVEFAEELARAAASGDGAKTIATLLAGGGLERFTAAARVAAAAISGERVPEDGRSRVRTFWERLLGGGYRDPVTARDEAIASGVLPATHYLPLAFELDPNDESRTAAEMQVLRAAAVETFRSASADLALIEERSALAVLVPVTRELDVENTTTAATLFPKSLAKRAESLAFTLGVGTVEPLLDVRHGLERARTARAIVRRLFGPGRVGVYGTLGAYVSLLRGATVDELRAFAATTLAPLRAYDEKHQTELERTLRVYFTSGDNVKTAATELCVHRHTVFYRLRQIAEITGRRLENHHDQLTLRLAIAIDALHTDQ